MCDSILLQNKFNFIFTRTLGRRSIKMPKLMHVDSAFPCKYSIGFFSLCLPKLLFIWDEMDNALPTGTLFQLKSIIKRKSNLNFVQIKHFTERAHFCQISNCLSLSTRNAVDSAILCSVPVCVCMCVRFCIFKYYVQTVLFLSHIVWCFVQRINGKN